jgi:hypothetical protein
MRTIHTEIGIGAPATRVWEVLAATPEDVGRCRFEQFETFSGLLAGPILWTAEAPTRQEFEAMNRALKARAEAP